jgi:hypothetical protein
VPRLDPLRDDRELFRLPRTENGLPDVRVGDVLGVVRADAVGVGRLAAAGAMPHTEQNPSSTVPVQPGCAHAAPSAAGGGAAVGWAVAAGVAGAMPHTVQNPSSMVPVQPGRTHAVMAPPPSL